MYEIIHYQAKRLYPSSQKAYGYPAKKTGKVAVKNFKQKYKHPTGKKFK